MGQNTDKAWSQAWTVEIGQNIQRIRKALGVSAAQLSEACSELGYGIPRSTIANLESGRKESVPVHEIVVIAEALGVPPLQLLYPIDKPSSVAYLPGQEASPHSAWNKFGRGLNQHIGTGEIAGSSAQETPQAILDDYAVLTSNEKSWLRLREAMRTLVHTRDNSTKRLDAFSQEMDMVLFETVWAFDELVDAGLPLPAISQDFIQALRKVSEYQREQESGGSVDEGSGAADA